MKALLTCILTLAAITAAQAVIVEDFEDGSISDWVNLGTTASATAAAAHDGNYGMQVSGGGFIYRDDAQVHVQQGDELSFWVRTTLTTSNRCYSGFGATASGCYSIICAPNTSTFLIQLNQAYGYLDLASVPQTWQLGHWYKIVVDWAVGGLITCYLYDSDGTTLLNQVSTTNTVYTGGGIAARSFSTSDPGYWDTFAVNGGTPPTATVQTTWGNVKALYR